MSVFGKTAGTNPFSPLPPVDYTPQPKRQDIPREFDSTPRESVADQEGDNTRQARMKAKLDEVKQKYRWDTSRAWAYLVQKEDPDFLPDDEESSPPPRGLVPKRSLDSTPSEALADAKLDQAKKMLRQQVESSLGELDAQLRLEYPDKDSSERQALSKLRNPELHRYARAIETGQAWQPPKPEPVYRFVETGRAKPKKVEARKPLEDDREVMLVYGSSGELIDIEFV